MDADDKFEGFHKNRDTEEAQEDSRELNEFEKNLLEQFRENDEEIDGMLDQVIDKISRLHLHAQDIETAIDH